MKTDGLGRGPASRGCLHPFLLSSFPPPAFFFLLHFLSFRVWICLLYALLFLSSGTLFLLLTFFLKLDRDRERRAKFLTFSDGPLSLPPPPSPNPSALWTASPCDKFCCYCLGICFGQIYKCSQGTIKNVFGGGEWVFFFWGLPPPHTQAG